jgi:glutamate--cysteine ligase
VASRYRHLDVGVLREIARSELFAWGKPGVEGFALSLEALPVVWPTEKPAATWARASEPRPAVPEVELLREHVRAESAALGASFQAGGPWQRTPVSGAWIELGPGGQVRVSSGWQGTPARAATQACTLFDRLRARLAASGLGLVCVGRDPWHPPQARPSADGSPHAECVEHAFATTLRGLEALRSTAGAEVRIAFGGPVKGPRRWRAAWLLAPRLAALFANSPLENGVSARCKSARVRAWLEGEPSRCGIPHAILDAPQLSPEEQYVQFALAARVLWVALEGEVRPQPQALTFSQWMATGVEGWFPDRDDWRAHLATLRPLVRPDGGLVISAFDAQERAFAALPLLVTSALLADDSALEAVLAKFTSVGPRSAALLAAAVSDGLLDAELARGSRELLALVAEVLLRAPRGWAAPDQVAALVAFERELTRAHRTPADALLEMYLERGELGRSQLAQYEQHWCALAGTPVS